MQHSTSCNLEQMTVDKFKKLSEISLSMECFMASFLRFSGINVKIYFFGGRLSIGYQI